MRRILVVEDNPDLAFGLRNNLEIEGYEVSVAHDGTTALALAEEVKPDLIILDLGIPDPDGFRVLRTIRDRGDDVPVMILSAAGEETSKVRGLRIGADDFVTKPFGILELLARVEALLRRPRPALYLRLRRASGSSGEAISKSICRRERSPFGAKG